MALAYFNEFISPVLESSEEMRKVIYNNRSLTKIRVIGKDNPMEAKRLRPGDSELIQLACLIARFGFDERDDHEELMLKFTTAMREMLDPPSLKVLLEDIANNWHMFKNSRRVRELLKYSLFLDLRCLLLYRRQFCFTLNNNQKVCLVLVSC